MSMITKFLEWLCPLYPESYDLPPFYAELLMTKTTLLPSDTEWEIVLFRSSVWNGYYIYAPNVNYQFDLTELPELKWLMSHEFTLISKPDDVDLEDWDHLYLCANADCFSPPLYVVSAQNEGDALDEFICNTNACVIDDDSLKDYDEDSIYFDDNGRPNDIEQVVISRLFPVMALHRWSPGHPGSGG